MRPILFRGKSVKPGSVGKWVEGSYLDELEPNSEGNQHFILDPRRGTKRKYPIDPETRGEFSGETDIEGNMLFEGDIYHHGDPNIKYVIVHHDNGLIGKQIGTSSYAGLKYWINCTKRIGNIFDNPELIKKAT